MSIKPSVVFIKGVHSTTGSDKTSDIGFPQLELEKLFEGAASKKVGSGEIYDSSKKYIYYDSSNSQAVIQDEGHFNCIKNGYYSIANGVNHYYTLSGNNYNYNTVPDTSTWAGKWSFSNAIKNKDLYSISNEGTLICVDRGGYYKKNGGKYEKQTSKAYTLYEAVDISWDDNNNKYICKPTLNENDDIIDKWKTSNNSLAESGYYISIIMRSNGQNNTYIVQLLNISFTDGVCNSGISSAATLYKFNTNVINGLYVKNGNHLNDPTNQLLFTSDPTATIEYFYHEIETWQYPNMLSPSVTPALMKDPNGNLLSYSTADYPLYEEATATAINKIQNTSYTIYEKTAVKINYNYSGDANSLKFIFTDKTIPEVLEACGLDNSLGKYVHLTNLEYNRN